MSDFWTSKLRKLNPNVSKAKGAGNARFPPHKPPLLPCLIDLAEAGELAGLELAKTPELRLRFDSYWGIVQASRQGRKSRDLFSHPTDGERKEWRLGGIPQGFTESPALVISALASENPGRTWSR